MQTAVKTLGWQIVSIAACAGLLASSAAAHTGHSNSQKTAEAMRPPTNAPTMSADAVPGFLSDGFQQLYSLNFQGARRQFTDYEKARPEDPMGKAAEAASYLFQEFNTKGVLSSDFFLDDDKLLKGLSGDPEANANPDFVAANDRARQMAQDALKANPADTNALLVLTITDGMESDYDQIVERKQIPALSLTKQAEAEAHKLLALDPTAKDAYVALGAAHYIIGCLPGYKRAFLWFGGIHGDREKGMEEMKIAASQGGYLKPFAKILLALAYRREHEPAQARKLLTQLNEEFPSNPRFAYELSLVERQSGTTDTPSSTPAVTPAQCCK
ncbi:MAG TPA: hypothetical protein VFW94_16595 [Candidatus Acidoferrales bacterium]|nr:hypothetical protein [Candidatus Acidoferrales bacterium]